MRIINGNELQKLDNYFNDEIYRAHKSIVAKGVRTTTLDKRQLDIVSKALEILNLINNLFYVHPDKPIDSELLKCMLKEIEVKNGN